MFVKYSKYETRPLEKALQSAFESDLPLFRSSTFDDTERLKVAVTATSASGSKAYVLSNYNAPHSTGMEYSRLRPNASVDEFYVWEA